MSFYLGIDAGGTKTVCALADEDGRLSRAEAGSIKPGRVSPEDATTILRSLLRQAAEHANVSLDRIASTCIGIAGLRLPGTRPWVESALRRMLNGELVICGDEEIALDAAFKGEAGVLVVAGTGSNVVGRGRGGQLFNVGGWGPGIGDEGSGHWIGHRALNAACHAYDRGEPTQLLDRFMQFWSASDLGEMVAIANQPPPPEFSRLAPVVVDAAAQGDAVAIRVLAEAGHLLADSALTAYRKVQAADDGAEPLDPLLDAERPAIAFTGGILRHALAVRQSMIADLRTSLPTVHIVEEPIDALEGAIWRARRALTA